MRRSDVKKVFVHRDNLSIDNATQNAYFQACDKFGADDCGHFGKEYRVDFPRSESRIVVQFVGMKAYGTMMGQDYCYEFEAWLEQIDDDEDWHLHD